MDPLHVQNQPSYDQRFTIVKKKFTTVFNYERVILERSRVSCVKFSHALRAKTCPTFRLIIFNRIPSSTKLSRGENFIKIRRFNSRTSLGWVNLGTKFLIAGHKAILYASSSSREHGQRFTRSFQDKLSRTLLL